MYRGPLPDPRRGEGSASHEHPNDAIIKVELAAICGSDLHLYHGMMADTRIGHTFGHEFAGTVDEVGPSVQDLQVGDRVMVPFNVFCGTCYRDRSGQQLAERNPMNTLARMVPRSRAVHFSTTPPEEKKNTSYGVMAAPKRATA